MRYYQQQMPPNMPVVVRPPRPPKRYRFRWPIVYVPILVFLTMIIIRYVSNSVQISFNWDDIMDYFRIRNRGRIQMLVILGIVATTIAVIGRILRPKKKEEDR